MSEEMNRREVELNEAALEGVSGGGYSYERATRDAQYFCDMCYTDNPSKRACADAHMSDLAAYLYDRGPGKVNHCKQCPFYKS